MWISLALPTVSVHKGADGKVGVSLKNFKRVGWVFVQKWFIGIIGSPKICGHFIKIIWISFRATEATQSLEMALKEFVFGVNSIMK